ncbi:hypothetical protein CY35_08G074000 [Sphagnum magellanicum]|jgi:hypothetical protein|nr:hypothetical protein CY35_08G074000 [Sphagnum magellanicum]
MMPHFELLLKNWCGKVGIKHNECSSNCHAVTFCGCLLSTWLFLPETRLHYLPPLESLLVVDEEGSRRRQLKVDEMVIYLGRDRRVYTKYNNSIMQKMNCLCI